MGRLEFQVTGMVCSGCSETVARVVGVVSGVSAANVDHESGAAVVDHDSADAEAIYAAIRDAGFGVRTCGNEYCACPDCHCDPCKCLVEHPVL